MGVRRGFQKGITLGGKVFGSVYFLVLQKNLQIFASELGLKSGVMRGFQKGITLGGRVTGRVHIVGLQKRLAKKFAKFLHLSLDSSWES